MKEKVLLWQGQGGKPGQQIGLPEDTLRALHKHPPTTIHKYKHTKDTNKL